MVFTNLPEPGRSNDTTRHGPLKQSSLPVSRLPASRTLPKPSVPRVGTPAAGIINQRKPSAIKNVRQDQPTRVPIKREPPAPKPARGGRGYVGTTIPPTKSRHDFAEHQTRFALQPPSRGALFESVRTPSLVSGSSVSTTGDSPRSNMLRRKASLSKAVVDMSPDLGSNEQRRKTNSPHTREEDAYSDAVFGISLPKIRPSQSIRTPDMDILNFDRFINQQPSLITHNLPPTPLYAQSATPSTRYSPGPFSISSTPTSMSCYSPATVATSTNGTKLSLNLQRQISPADIQLANDRKPTGDDISTRGAKNRIPARQNSSSSGSTVKASEDGRKIRSPVASENTSGLRLNRVRTGMEVQDRKPATLQKKPPSGPMRPPEFAHLANASPIKRPDQQCPPRPTRDNTPDLVHKASRHVVQSNMSSLPTMIHKREGSIESRKNSLDISTTETRHRFGLPRKFPSRNPSPVPSSSLPMKTSGGNPATMAKDRDNEKGPKSQPSPSPVKSSRFGLFKRGKSEPQVTTLTKEKPLRRGPVAGSGHEGYGKFGLRGRSGSSTSGNTSAGRSSSAGSTRGTITLPGSRKSSVGSRLGTEVDDFLADRLSPITLRGAGGRDESNVSSNTTSLAITTSSTSLDRTVSSSTTTDEGSQKTLLPSAVIDVTRSSSPVVEDNSISHDAKFQRLGEASLSTRRSSRRSMVDVRPIFTSQEEIPSATNYQFRSHPAVDPLARKLSEPAPELGSFAISSSSVPTQNDATRTTPNTPKLSRKWNFLWSNKPLTKPFEEGQLGPSTAFPVSKHLPRSVAHYALQDAPEKIDVSEIEKIMQEAEELDSTTVEESQDAETTSLSTTRHGDSILLPAPPAFVPEFALPSRPASPKVALQNARSPERPKLEKSILRVEQERLLSIEVPPNTRPSRLAQVGRIPRVVSKRDRDRKPPFASYSRPFDTTLPSPASNSPQVPDSVSASGFTTTTGSGSSSGYSSCMIAHTLNPMDVTAPVELTASPESIHGHIPYLALPLRKDSDISIPSSRSSINRLAPLVIPSPRIPSQLEDPWQEYDDLFEYFSPEQAEQPKTPHTGSSLGAPFHYANFGVSPVDTVQSPTCPFPVHNFVPSVPSMMRRLRVPSVRDSTILRNSQSLTMTPTSPVSISDFPASHTDRRASALATLTGRRSLPPPSRSSSGALRMSLPRSVPEVSDEDEAVPRISHNPTRQKRDSKRDSVSIQVMEAQHMGFEDMANLRYNALMTSKSLSFGRLLFSPAHSEMKDLAEDRVLVLDGLGRDWSFHLAMHYTNAMVYNLGTDPDDCLSPKKPTLDSLPNHSHIHHADLSITFPFPKGFFAAVVFRFPAIASEATYKFALGECKRVLRPGGYLEISVLDMDMLNMGNRGRRALRSLKERINADDTSVSLKSISDTVQKLLGRRGFENLSRCVVGVPAAGCIPSSQEGSTIGPSVHTPSGFPNSSSMPSFGDVVRDQSASGDYGITRMVARVARWWYSRCYESIILADGDMNKSIWSDAALLKECEERGTSLRLMVCFAQKPECAVRRTISV